ncbi:hypothetical protein F4808DRAFT_259567 [Astrocystis sublimbata]|nr:hypothetical protein F4808DRAFT_259567 [Astrocystis sublimbata]
MALALRLTILSCVVAHTKARAFQAAINAGDWTPPATPAGGHATSGPDGWVPKTTPAPVKRPLDWGLGRRDDSSPTICGYSADNLNGPAITCESGEFCRLNKDFGIVGCCTATNPRGCIVPTTCLESSNSAQWSGDPLTTYCGDSHRPHCVTHSYEANFYDPLYEAYFVGCASRAATGDIVASLGAQGDASSSTSLSTFTTTDGVRTTTVTVSFPGNDGSATAVPPGAIRSHSSRNVGAIVGGTIGGVAGLALIIAAIFFFLHRRKRRSEASGPDPLGRKMPPSDHDIYYHEAIPGSQYPSTFYGEAPPGMAQMSDQPVMGYPPDPYGMQNPTYPAETHANTGIQNTSIPNTGAAQNTGMHNASIPAHCSTQAMPSKPQDELVSPIEDSPVSPVSPAENYNTMVSALSNPSPPLQPLQPAVYRPHQQSEYAQYSPPPPDHWRSYHPYPGT